MSTEGKFVFALFEWLIVDFLRYVEGIVRGYRNSLLSGQNYSNLTQCETIDGTLSWSCGLC